MTGPPTLVVIAGHGGRDPGAVVGDLAERDVNAAVGRRLVDRLRDHGIDVATDLDMGNPPHPEELDVVADRPGIAYHVAVHHNAAPQTGLRGAESYGFPGPALELARVLQDAQLSALRLLDRTVVDRGARDAAGSRAAKHLVPGRVAALLEPGFLTNDADRAVLTDERYPALVAEALCRALVDHGRADGRWTTSYRSAGIALTPRFSVVIPTHNRPDLLAEAVDSVLAQTVTGLEVLVADDGSDPPVGPFDDPRVRVLRLEKNRGPAAARNAGLDQARGDVVTFLDDDDRWTPDRLDLAAVGLRRTPVAICWTRHLAGPGGGHRTITGHVGDALLEGTTPCLGATAVRREVCPRFDERWQAIEDVVWWWRLAVEQPVTTVPTVGYLVRLHDRPRHRNGVDKRVVENLALLEEESEHFERNPAAAAHRWIRVGVLAARSGSHGLAVRAFVRAARARPTPLAAARVVRAVGWLVGAKVRHLAGRRRRQAGAPVAVGPTGGR